MGFGSSQFSSANVDGMSIYMRFDEETLKAIALATAAEYFHAGSGADLKKVYETLNARYVLEKKETEISALLCALGALLILIAAGLSVASVRPRRHRVGEGACASPVTRCVPRFADVLAPAW